MDYITLHNLANVCIIKSKLHILSITIFHKFDNFFLEEGVKKKWRR